jgi:hypothetical protein
MAWTAPMTAAANATLTAAQWNAQVRDNMAHQAPAQATAPGRHMVVSGAHAMVERATSGATVATAETRTSAAYGAVATAGPSVTVTTGTSALVWITAGLDNAVLGAGSYASFAVSGASTVAASDTWAVYVSGQDDVSPARRGVARRVTGLNAGANTFTMQYRVSSGTGTFSDREIIVMPF